MRLVVTGCNGYIGGHLVEALLRGGHQVVGIDHRAESWQNFKEQGDYRLVQLELADRASIEPLARAVEGADAILHLASHQPYSWDPAPFVYGNVNRAVSMLEAARLCNTPRIVLSSTYAIYGNAERVPIVESDPPRPVTIYDVTKYQAEMLAEVYAKLSDVRIAALRYTSVYGGRNRVGSLYYFLESAVLGRPIKLFARGVTVRDYVHVDDVVAANMGALAAELPAGVDSYNIGGDDPLSTAALVDLIFEVTGHKTEIQFADDPNWKAADLYVDVSKARRQLSFQPTPMRDGLSRFWQEVAPSLMSQSA